MKHVAIAFAALLFSEGAAQAAQQDELERAREQIEKQFKKIAKEIRKFGRSAEKWVGSLFERFRRRPEAPPPERRDVPKMEKPAEVTPRKTETFRFDAWEGWNAFAPGSSVEFEMDAGGTKMTVLKTLEKKGAERHELKTFTRTKVGDSESKFDGSEAVLKSRPMEGGDCPLCSKPYASHDPGKWTEEVLKIGERDVKCMKLESPAKNCKGEATPATLVWYSKEVPGWWVRMESPNFKMRATAFDAKK